MEVGGTTSHRGGWGGAGGVGGSGVGSRGSLVVRTAM